MRADLQLIPQWIKPKSKVLDLGCGDGELLAKLQSELECKAYGIEIDQQSILSCIEKKVNVIHTDLINGLDNFDDDSFDTVLMAQSLQAMMHPDQLVKEMLRVGKEAIISFPNMGHWRARFHLFTGKMPVTKTLPHAWYNTPNIHLCTMRDFEQFCSDNNIKIVERSALNAKHKSNILTKLFPSLFSQIAIYSLQDKI